ncbi:MAG: nucleotide sugar dehydrogenase [Nitrospira sp.]|nr:nucleotide sugar dehydrogenase [Nitrospira sp.]
MKGKTNSSLGKSWRIAVIGGAGHVGLPLSLVLADRGFHVTIVDTDEARMRQIQNGDFPFLEQGGAELLAKLREQGREISYTSSYKEVESCDIIIVTIGTPIDEFLNPSTKAIIRCFESLLPYLSDRQLVALRSTVSPGTTEWLDRYLRGKGKAVKLAFCPERILQGQAIQELQGLPQIVSGTTREAEEMAATLFSSIAPELVYLKPMEAEFAKLYCNVYRYIQFSISNQFFMIANSAGLDYYRILEGMKKGYRRMQDMPRAGFAAGPCLFKDTMQLAAFCSNEFSLGSSAMLINEGLPLYMVDQIARQYELSNLTVGLLGMAFKADSDDPRSSLSYKLKKVLLFRAKRVLTTDPHVKGDSELVPTEEVVEKSDLLILCAPHAEYKNLDSKNKPIFDVWNYYGRGGLI